MCVCVFAGSCIYFSTSLLCTCLFIRLARRWPQLIADWTLVERRFMGAPYRRPGRLLLRTKIRATALGFFVLAFGEQRSLNGGGLLRISDRFVAFGSAVDYFIYSLQTMYSYTLKVQQCGWSDAKHVQRYFTLENLFIFDTVPFSVPLAITKTVGFGRYHCTHTRACILSYAFS